MLPKPQVLRGLVLGKYYFWLLELNSITRWPASVSWGSWTDGGSAAALRSFFPPLPWHVAVDEACHTLGVLPVTFLGEGAMARVFSANDHGQPVAVKVVALKTLLDSNEQGRIAAQLERDFNLLQSLQGQNLPVVKVVSEFYRTENCACFAMTPVGTRTVNADDLKNDGIYKACAVLHDLHTNSVVHGDPRLDNLLKLSNGRVIWTDLAQGSTNLPGELGEKEDIKILARSCLHAVYPGRELSFALNTTIESHDRTDRSWKSVREAIREDLDIPKKMILENRSVSSMS
jgi:tRNA A-37 threonylcarbamoyl transferase component Bud32